jgi:hypothetical protein
VFGTNKMINACNVSGKGLYAFDYDTRATNNGFTHEVASGHPTAKRGISVSAIHGSTNIIGDHDDSINRLYVGDFSITTGTFPKYFLTYSAYMNDLNYIEGTVLVMATANSNPLSIEIHITT